MSITAPRCGRHTFSISAACGLAGLVALAALSYPAVAAASDETVGVRSVTFSPNGQWLVATTGEPNQQGTVTLWEVARRKQLWRHTEPTGIPAAAFSPDGRTLAIAVYDKAARLLDAATGQVKATFKHPKEVRSVAFSPDGTRLATACWDGLLRVWDIAAQAEKVTCAGHRGRIFSVVFSPNGKFLLSVAGDDGAKLWDSGSGAEIGVFKHYYMPCAGFTPNGQSVITGAYDGTTRLWDIGAGALRIRFSGTDGVKNFAFSQAARTLAVSGTGRDISLFSLTFAEPTARELERIRQLLVKLDDDSYDIREAASKELLELGFTAEAELRRATNEGCSVEVRVRARRLREQMLSKPLVLRGHTGEVESVAFSPDGKTLASGGKDGIVRLWDLASRKETACLLPGR